MTSNCLTFNHLDIKWDFNSKIIQTRIFFFSFGELWYSPHEKILKNLPRTYEKLHYCKREPYS